MKTVEILIVTRSVVLQQELGALLESLPEVASVKSVRDVSTTYKWIEERQPKIILLDENLLAKNSITMSNPTRIAYLIRGRGMQL